MVKNPPQINLDKVRLKVLKPTEKGWTQQIVNVVVGRKRIGDIELSLYKEKHTVYIEWMEIYEQHRCAGAGSAAYRLLETYIRKAYYWCKRIVLCPADKQAWQFWRRCGFVSVDWPRGETEPIEARKILRRRKMK